MPGGLTQREDALSTITNTAAPLRWLVLGAALVAGSFSCADEIQTDNRPRAACCDCTCGNNGNACLNILATTAPGSGCSDACALECSAHEDCPDVEIVASCPTTPEDGCPSATAKRDDNKCPG